MMARSSGLALFALLSPAAALLAVPLGARVVAQCHPPLHALCVPARARPPLASARTVVVTDMDETLISKKSTGYVINFLVKLRAFRLLLVPLLAAVLIPISKLSRTFAVRAMYWFAFRGVRVDKAKKIAEEFLAPEYAADLQDPAASAVMNADDAIIITASPDFMARPWLEKYLKVKPENVYGAVLEESSGGRFTGRTMQIPIGEAKAELLRSNPLANAPDTTTVGYGDHPTDLPFLQACSRGVLVHELASIPKGIEYIPAAKFTGSTLQSQ